MNSPDLNPQELAEQVTYLVQVVRQLESRLTDLEKFLETKGYRQEFIGSAQVYGAMEIPKIETVNLSEPELIENYNRYSQELAAKAIKVTLTENSLVKQSSQQISFEPAKNGNFWIIATEEEVYWLIPKYKLRIDTYKYEAIQFFFECYEYQQNNNTEFNLFKPARVTPIPNSELWQLEQPGILLFSNSVSPEISIEIENQELDNIFEPTGQKVREVSSEELPDSFSDNLSEEQRTVDSDWNLNFLSDLFTDSPPDIFSEEQSATNLDPSLYSSFNIVAWENVQLVHTITGHTNSVSCIAISPDGQILASGSFDRTIKLWNLQTKELVGVLNENSLVKAITISPDSKILVSGSDDKTVKIWHLASGELQQTLTGHLDSIRAIAISPDGKIVVSGSRDKTIKIWELQTGELINTLSSNRGSLLSVAISPDSKILASGSADDNIRTWNLQTGEMIHTLYGKDCLFWSVAISPDGETLISGSLDNTIRIWNLHSGKLQDILGGHEKEVLSLAINPDGKILVSGGGDQKIKLWNLATKELLCTLTGHNNEVYCLAISPDGQTLVSGSRDKTIKIWRSQS